MASEGWVSEPILSAPLLGGRVLELSPEGRAWRLSVVQIDGRDRRQCGGVSLTACELPLYLASLQAMAAYVKQAA
jgi:hypothetical protein